MIQILVDLLLSLVHSALMYIYIYSLLEYLVKATRFRHPTLQYNRLLLLTSGFFVIYFGKVLSFKLIIPCLNFG